MKYLVSLTLKHGVIGGENDEESLLESNPRAKAFFVQTGLFVLQKSLEFDNSDVTPPGFYMCIVMVRLSLTLETLFVFYLKTVVKNVISIYLHLLNQL